MLDELKRLVLEHLHLRGSSLRVDCPLSVDSVTVDHIVEETANHGIDIDGLLVKDGKLTTDNSVVAANITAGAVDATKLSTSAISRGYARVVTGQTVANNVEADLTNLSVAVEVPEGGRRVKITGFLPTVAASVSNNATSLYIKQGTNYLASVKSNVDAGKQVSGWTVMWISATTVTPGTYTYKLSLKNDVNASTSFSASATSPAFISVELI